MKRMIVVFIMGLCLALVGCGKEEPTTTSKQTSEPEPQPAATAPVVKQAEQAVEQAKEKVAAVTEQTKKKVAEVTEQTKEKVTEVTVQAEDKVAQVKSQAENLLGAVPAGLPGTSSAVSGEAIYSKNCSSCHKFGAIGAPKTGDKAVWAPLISRGVDILVENSINGLGKMPARGGNSKLTDAEVKAAVVYMVEQSQ